MVFDPPLIVIAAGGDGSRLGGNKPTRLLNEQRLIDHIVLWARDHSDTIMLAVRQGGSDWGTGLPLLYDRYQDIGPISALESAMREALRQGRETLVLLGCDLPFLPEDMISRLSQALGDKAAALPVSHGRIHPMAGLWRAAPERLDDWIQKGGQSMWRFAQEAGMAEVVWTELPDPFTNINDQGTLTFAEELIKTRGK